MRTTVDIHEGLLERAKEEARASGRRLGDVVNDALREMFSRRERQEAEGAEEAMPISEVGGRGLREGLDLSDTAELLDELEGLAGRDPAGGPPPQLDELR